MGERAEIHESGVHGFDDGAQARSLALAYARAGRGQAHLENHVMRCHFGLENPPKLGQEPRADDAVEETV